jgi:hypothetical protein
MIGEISNNDSEIAKGQEIIEKKMIPCNSIGDLVVLGIIRAPCELFVLSFHNQVLYRLYLLKLC